MKEAYSKQKKSNLTRSIFTYEHVTRSVWLELSVLGVDGRKMRSDGTDQLNRVVHWVFSKDTEFHYISDGNPVEDTNQRIHELRIPYYLDLLLLYSWILLTYELNRYRQYILDSLYKTMNLEVLTRSLMEYLKRKI